MNTYAFIVITIRVDCCPNILKRRGFFNAASDSHAVKVTSAFVPCAAGVSVVFIQCSINCSKVSVVFSDAQRGNQAFAIEQKQ